MFTNKKGIGLVELAVTVAIAIALGAGLMTTFLVARNARSYADAMMEMEQSTRQALLTMSMDLRHATSLDIDDVAGINDSDIITFERISLCAHQGSACESESWQFVRYLLNDQNQLIRQFLDADKVIKKTDILATDISGFVASPPETDADDKVISFDVYITAEKQNLAKTKLRFKKITFRNVCYEAAEET